MTRTARQEINGAGSDGERALETLIRMMRWPEPVREFAFWEGRRFRFDFAWPDLLLAVEVEGGTWVNGAHSRGSHFESDCTKYNRAAVLGWKVLRFTTEMVTDGRAVTTLEKVLPSPEQQRLARVTAGVQVAG